MENHETPTKEAIEKARFLLKYPDLLRAYQQSRMIYHNSAPIYGNTTKIYDEIGPAIKYLAEAKPGFYQSFADALQKIVDSLNDIDYERAIAIWTPIVAAVDSLNSIQWDSQSSIFWGVLKAFVLVVMAWLKERGK